MGNLSNSRIDGLPASCRFAIMAMTKGLLAVGKQIPEFGQILMQSATLQPCKCMSSIRNNHIIAAAHLINEQLLPSS